MVQVREIWDATDGFLAEMGKGLKVAMRTMDLAEKLRTCSIARAALELGCW